MCLIFCGCGGGVIPEEKHKKLASQFKGLDIDVLEMHDLCAFSINEQHVLRELGENYQRKIIAACYPRAVKNILKQGGVDLGNFEVVNFKELSSEQIQKRLQDDFKIENGEANYQVLKNNLEVPAWYPVIEEERCTLCGKCARFCLFGVYRYNKKNLEVVQPLACKNYCPACGRTCPSSAIIFPRLKENSVLAGAEPDKSNQITGQGELFVMLSDRNRTRQNIFRDGVMKQAEEERRKALEEIKKLKDIE